MRLNTMTLTVILTVLIGICASCASVDRAIRAVDPAPENAGRRAATVYYGQQAFEDDRIEDDVRADTFGVQYEYVYEPGEFDSNANFPIVSEVGFFFGTEDTQTFAMTPTGPSHMFDVSFTSYEAYLGLRKDWNYGRLIPYLGAGVNCMLVDVEALGGSDKDIKLGGYAKTGARYQISERWALGAEARYRASEDFEVSDDDGNTIEGDLDGLSVLVGVTWGF